MDDDILIKILDTQQKTLIQVGHIKGAVEEHSKQLDLIRSGCQSRYMMCSQEFAKQEQTGRISLDRMKEIETRRKTIAELGKVIAWVAGIVTVALAVMAFLSCAVPFRGFAVTGQNSDYTLNTKQKCIYGAETAKFTDAVLPLVIREMEHHGYVKDYFTTVKRLQRVMVCTIDEPEPCCSNKSCAPPFVAGKPQPKAGCTVDLSIWVARKWPGGVGYSWSSTLVHEIINLVAISEGISTDYSGPLYMNLEPQIQKKVRSMQ